MKLAKFFSTFFLFAAMSMAVCAGFAPAHVVFAQNHTIDDPMPFFENSLETDHFVLKWTNKSRHASDNISDPQIIKDTAGYLETAWEKYTTLFGRKPYTAPGRDKIDVVFRDIDCYGVADPPSGPIQFNAFAWVQNSGIRQPTSAHELFHRMQYAYGYKTKWHPREPYMWFTEGTAAWSEVFVWGRVSRTCKVDTIFRDCKLGLYDAEDMAMPFWIYFVQGNHEHPNHQLMVKLFEKFEQLGDEKQALREVLTEAYGSADGFLKSFAKDRRNGFWSDTCDMPYRCILGPDGKDLVQEVRDMQQKK
jgi:hypothetical protein